MEHSIKGLAGPSDDFVEGLVVRRTGDGRREISGVCQLDNVVALSPNPHGLKRGHFLTTST
jgi:hypothetical protein